MCKMDILRHYGFVVGQNQSTINAPPPASVPINNSSSNGRLNIISSSAESSDNLSQSRQVTDV